MPSLNLNATNDSTKRIKEYLEKSASDVLADKINNGVQVEKDGKTLLNKKTLDGFMKYATDEARKLAEKGATYACVDDATVFGWAIHYFEEDSIEEKLYNLDGTEYVKPKKATPQKKTTNAAKKTESKPKAQPTPKKETVVETTPKAKETIQEEKQLSLLDIFGDI